MRAALGRGLAAVKTVSVRGRVSVMMNRIRRVSANTIILTFLCVILIDGLPPVCEAHYRLKDAVDPMLDATGLWQQTWALFAPEPDFVNSRVSARIDFEDGTTEYWESPDWKNTSAAYRFVKFRQMEYFDRLRMDANSPAWEPFAKHLASTVPPPDESTAKVVLVRLRRHWVNIPPPEETDSLMKIRGDWSRGESAVFYTWANEE